MKPKIRVLHLIDNLDLGGAQTVLFGCLQNYDRDRFDLTLAALHANRRTVFLNRARKLGAPVLTLSPRRWFPWYLSVTFTPRTGWVNRWPDCWEFRL
jgi:hypothetical protein